MDYKIVVNNDKLYDKNYFSNRELKVVSNSLDEEYLLEKRTLRAYLSLKDDLEKDNIFIDIISGYRSIEEQEEIIELFTKKYGSDYVNKYVAGVNASEHHTGLCFDIGLIIEGKLVYDSDELLKYDDIFIKIIERLPKFGLILRYPKDKEMVTKYNYEPWHYRYVGNVTASLIRSNNLCLEEYDELYNKSGVILINKPKGITSRDVVNRVSEVFDTRKVGHNGTLDPLAEGVLVVTINKACKINELLTSEDKDYVAGVKVGLETDTLDIEGRVVKESDKRISRDMLDNLFKSFPNKYLQEVPKYSAVKIDGKKLYEYAREEKEISLPKREVLIKELELISYDDSSFKFRCVVSKGTYIRSLIKDMGDMLDIPCTMESLVRTRQGKFLIDDTINLDSVNISSKLITISDALDIKRIEIDDKEYNLICNGASISNHYNIKDKVLFIKDNRVIALYQNVNNTLKCYKMLK